MELTEQQKEHVKQDFREYSGGYDAGEAYDEVRLYIDNYENLYPEGALQRFMLEWEDES